MLLSESFIEFSITMYVSNTKSIPVERISLLLFLDKYSLIGLVISWSSSKGTMRESSQTSGVSRDRTLYLGLSTRFCAVASYLEKLFLLAAFDVLH